MTRILAPEDLHGYQNTAVDFILKHPLTALFIDLGLGKTAISLTAAARLFDRALIKGVIYIAPRRVAESVVKQETQKWTHLRHLTVCVLRGTNKNLLMRDLVKPFHIHVLNYEAIPWFVNAVNQIFLARGRPLPWDMIIFDELTRVKNPEGTRIGRFYAKNKNGHSLLDYFTRRVGMTGTPAPNGYWDLHGQFLALDKGVRLFDTQLRYEETYFTYDQYTRRRKLVDGAKEQIEKKISDITVNMQADDYLELPPYLYNTLWVDLPPKIRAQYDRLEEEMFAELDHGTVEIFNAASLTNKCRQLGNGIIVDTETGTVHPVHDAKLEALDSIVEEAAGQPLLVSYVFRGDMERIRARYEKRGLRVKYLGPGVGDAEGLGIIEAWNKGNVDILIAHHQSAGHGLNLQYGGHQVVWFGLDWPSEGWTQFNGRLRRQGQPNPIVIVHRILARHTIDEAVLERLEGKLKDQEDLRSALDALQSYRNAGQEKAA